MTIMLRIFTVMTFFLFAACEPSRQNASVTALETPAARGSLASQLFVHGEHASLSWLETRGSGHALLYSEWQGDRWSEAREVASGEDWFANWADLPGVRQGGSGWIAWWLEKSGPGTYAYDVQMARSEDGETWQRIGTPHHDGTQTEHGFVTAFDLGDSRLGMAWLDGRNTGGGSSGHDHHAGHGGGMTLRWAEFGAEGQLRESELDSLVCDCCQTDSARAGDAIVLVYRGRSEEEIRDIMVQRFEDGQWQQANRVHADNWKISGCPVNGPAVTAKDDFVAVAWFTAPEGNAQVRLAFSHDGGRSFGDPMRIDEGRPEGRVDVVLHPEHGVLASWLERTPDGAQVRLRPVSTSGSLGTSTTLVEASSSRASGFPRLAVLPDSNVLMTWTDADENGRQVHTALVRFE